ncbi:hypothetical protein [Vreelandella titanicae]|uniref:hypothetical protein n=1 Tax=Vreelandella titanicae TaxID=664683 RepID=UPI0039BF66C7
MEKPTESSSNQAEHQPNRQKPRKRSDDSSSVKTDSADTAESVASTSPTNDDAPIQPEFSGPDMNSDTNGSNANEAYREEQRAQYEGSRIDRHQKGTEQVGKILAWAHITASMLLLVATLLAITVFFVGSRIITVTGTEDAIPAHSWTTYLLVLAPVTLLALLGITIWVTSLKFSAQIYNGATESDNNDSDSWLKVLVTECLKQNNSGQ